MEVKTEMNIEKAVKHLSWRLSQSKIVPNEKDVEAFNFMIRTINKNHELAVMRDKCFAKLLVEKLLFLTMDGKFSMKQAVNIIEEILETPVYSWAKTFVKEVPSIRFSQVFEKKYIEIGLSDDDRKNVKKVIEAKRLIISKNKKELSDALTEKYSEDDFIKFFNRLVFELINKYQNLP
jgi:hypothetical protein